MADEEGRVSAGAPESTCGDEVRRACERAWAWGWDKRTVRVAVVHCRVCERVTRCDLPFVFTQVHAYSSAYCSRNILRAFHQPGRSSLSGQ
ncbi:hypothetical protein BDZ97DRAFT_1390250 [Flammula alnicola]|nr:hypothetical protein BDZ97DRAFT_1390250 [Flammula alnicola]